VRNFQDQINLALMCLVFKHMTDCPDASTADRLVSLYRFDLDKMSFSTAALLLVLSCWHASIATLGLQAATRV
jgi:hypothetical protein